MPERSRCSCRWRRFRWSSLVQVWRPSLGADKVAEVVARTVVAVSPGSSDSLVEQVIEGGGTSRDAGTAVVVAGLATAFAAATSAFAQFERGANRIYGVQRDRPGASALVGSSATSSRGSPASAMAISTRCSMPPESWCGYLRSWARRVGDVHLVEQLDGPLRDLGAWTAPVTRMPMASRELAGRWCAPG